MSTSNFPDVNVWVALAWRNHIHHDAALRWFLSSNQYNYFCRHTQLGFLRLITTRSMLGEDTRSLDDAWRLWDEVWEYRRIGFHPEPAGVESHFRNYTQGSNASNKLWVDAYLLAFARAAGLRLVTFDRALAARSMLATLLES